MCYTLYWLAVTSIDDDVSPQHSQYLGQLSLIVNVALAIFPDLPSEMGTEIRRQILLLADVESFELVSETTYAIATLFLRQHRRLKV